jgi:hypothetical protein
MEQGQRHTSRQWLRQARRHSRWLPLGTEVALGVGYLQTVQLAVTRRGCDERGCEQGMAVGDPYVVWWCGRSQVVVCLGHAPLPVEIRLPGESGALPVAARQSPPRDAGSSAHLMITGR